MQEYIIMVVSKRTASHFIKYCRYQIQTIIALYNVGIFLTNDGSFVTELREHIVIEKDAFQNVKKLRKKETCF